MTNNQLIGKLIRDLRKQRNVTGQELGRRVGMSQPKLSKIENGIYPTIRFREIERILNILDAPDSLRQQIYEVIDTSQKGTTHHEAYNIQYHIEAYKFELKVNSVRIFSLFLVPALLQTMDYRLALLKARGSTKDEMEIMKTTAKRQELLWDNQRNFHFIMHESALYSQLPNQRGPNLPQLDRIERFMALPHVKVGYIPMTASMPMIEVNAFSLLGDRLLVNATSHGEFHFTNDKSVELYSRIFTDLERRAVYGEEARRLIKTSIDHLS